MDMVLNSGSERPSRPWISIHPTVPTSTLTPETLLVWALVVRQVVRHVIHHMIGWSEKADWIKSHARVMNHYTLVDISVIWYAYRVIIFQGWCVLFRGQTRICENAPDPSIRTGKNTHKMNVHSEKRTSISLLLTYIPRMSKNEYNSCRIMWQSWITSSI